jgi:hypothetical protein
MLNLSLLDLFLRLLPEGFLLMFAAYALSGKKVDKKNLCISSILFMIIIFFVRKLPIHFGVHTILLFIVYTSIAVWINKIELMKAISSVLISTIIMLVGEGINGFMLDKLGVKLDVVFKDPLMKNLYFLPSLLIFLVIILIIKRFIRVRKVSGNVFN